MAAASTATTASTEKPPPEKSDKPSTKTLRWVENNRDGAHGCQLRGIKEETSGTIRPGAIINLLPGWNLVEAEHWAEFRKQNPMASVLLREKIQPSKAPEQKQERVGHKLLVEGPLADPADPLADLEEDDAITMVDDILDHRILERLLRVEKRARVDAALREQAEKIDPRRVAKNRR